MCVCVCVCMCVYTCACMGNVHACVSKYFLLLLPLFQEGQLSVTGKSMVQGTG